MKAIVGYNGVSKEEASFSSFSAIAIKITNS
jgi:hypothetical protein